MRMFNASLERWKTQCDSLVFKFNPARYDAEGNPIDGFIEVPDHLVGFIYERFKDRGVFKYPHGMSDEAFEEEKRKALLLYLGITLRERIVNYNAYHDDLRKKGATVIPEPAYERALRWQKELRDILNAQAPIEEELSFLETVRLKNTQLKKDEDPVADENASFEATPKKRGRPFAKPQGDAEVQA